MYNLVQDGDLPLHDEHDVSFVRGVPASQNLFGASSFAEWPPQIALIGLQRAPLQSWYTESSKPVEGNHEAFLHFQLLIHRGYRVGSL